MLGVLKIKMNCAFLSLTFALLSSFTETSANNATENVTATAPTLLGPLDFVNVLKSLFTDGHLNGLMDIMKPETLTSAIGTVLSFDKDQAIAPDKVKFYLYNNPRNPVAKEELFTGNITALSGSMYDPRKPLKILIHPWLGIPMMLPVLFPYSTKDVYLLLHGGKHNVILLDYTRTTGYPVYPIAATVGLKEAINNTVEFLKWLHEERMIDLNQTHIVGLSLGAHIGAGIADGVKRVTGVPIGRVTGLDPIGPMFFPKMPVISPPHTIRAEDARDVDIGHTNAILVGLGIMQNVGRADMYLNGGFQQPGCNLLQQMDAVVPGSGFVLVTSLIVPVCSHLIAGEFYSFSAVATSKEPSCACTSSLVSMINPLCCNARATFGEHSVPGTEGVLYMSFNPITSAVL